MKTPKILPWLAGKADIGEERAEALWREACVQAAAITGECNTGVYWETTLHILRKRLDVERWRTHSPLAWPWLLVYDGARQGSRLATRWRSSLQTAGILAGPRTRPRAVPSLLLWYRMDHREHTP